jgi:hypothetical protein
MILSGTSMAEKAIFIHSLFRTGSTYVWNTFRKNARYCCYYEPLHQDFVYLSAKRPDLWEFGKHVTGQMRFPALDKSLTHEYHPLLQPDKKRLPLFRKSFSFDEFCRISGNRNLKIYIDSLLENAGSRIPVFQFNRTALRIRWFKQNYPDAVHLYLVRHPHDQFQSYISMMQEHNLDIFFVMDSLIAGKSQEFGMFKRLGARIPLVRYRDRFFANEYLIYRIISRCYSYWERYFIFYFLWFYALYENVSQADLVINMDLLSQDQDYRRKVSRYLRRKGGHEIDFKDSSLRKYSSFTHRRDVMLEIERDVQTMFADNIDADDMDRFFAGFSQREKEACGFTQELSSLSEMSESRSASGMTDDNESVEEWIAPLAEEIIRKAQLIKKIQKEVVEEKTGLFSLGNEVAEIYTYIFKTGRLSERKKARIDRVDNRLNKINRKLAGLEASLTTLERKFQEMRSLPEGRDIRSVTMKQRHLAMQKELGSFNKWLDDQIEGITRQKQILEEKARLLRERRRKLMS